MSHAPTPTQQCHASTPRLSETPNAFKFKSNHPNTCQLSHEVQQCLALEEALHSEHIQQRWHHHTPRCIVAVELPLSQTLQR